MRHLFLAALLCLAVGPASAGPISAQPTDVCGMVGMASTGPLDTPTLITSHAGFTAQFGSSTAGLGNPYLGPSVAAFFASGGSSLYVVRIANDTVADFIGADGGPGARTGLQALREIDEISIVAAPGNSALAVQQAMINLCASMGDRLAILDCAPDADLASVQVHRAAITSPDGFATFYFPWIQAQPDGNSQMLPPSGFVAGICAATSAEDSPIAVVATATDVAVDLTAPEQDILNPLGINAIRDFGVQGIRVWGARTLATTPAWKYIATRRMQAHLEESIAEGTAWVVDQPNNAALWTSIEADVELFLYGKFSSGWFQGATANEAYFVHCDLSTMTQTDLDAGRTVILVGFAPLVPAEFVTFTVTHERNVGTDAPVAPRGSRITAVAPNPFNPRTLVRYDAGTSGRIELRAFDLQGRLVDVLVSGVADPGAHEFWWDARGLPSGVYLLRLDQSGQVSTRKITLLK